MPTDLLQKAGAASLTHPLYILMTRSRAIEPPRHDPEPTMARTFTLPTARTFALTGTAEINAGDSDYLINQLVGLTPAGPLPARPQAGPAMVEAAKSSTRLDGDRQARANAAVDGNPATAWIAETGPQAGEWVSYDLSKPISIDHLDLQLVNDGRHSLPTRLTVSTETGSRVVDLPAIAVGYGRTQGSTTTVPVSFPALTGSHIKVTIDAVKQVRALDYYATFTGATDILPVGIADLGLKVVQPSTPAQVPATCQSGLLRVDGQPVDVEITGSTTAALSGQPLAVHGCGNAANGIHLGAGSHLVQTSPRLPERLVHRRPYPGLGGGRVARGVGGGRVGGVGRGRAGCDGVVGVGGVRGSARRPRQLWRRRFVSTTRTVPARPSPSMATAAPFGSCSGRARAPGGRPPCPAGAASAPRNWSTATPTGGTCRPGS